MKTLFDRSWLFMWAEQTQLRYRDGKQGLRSATVLFHFPKFEQFDGCRGFQTNAEGLMAGDSSIASMPSKSFSASPLVLAALSSIQFHFI